MVAVAFVLIISIYLVISGLPAILEIGPINFLFGTRWYASTGDFGIFAIILTSIAGTAGAILIGVPIGLMTAIFLAKVANPKLAKVVHTAVELLAGIPSVVYGLVGMILLVPAIRVAFGLPSGATLLAAIIVLSIMILPSIISVSETALRAVPREYEEASLALGATHIETVFRVTVPAARSGIATAIVLGIGRAIGEAMAIIMVAGNVANMPGLLTPGALPHHRHRLGDVLRLRGLPAPQRPVLHRPGAVPVHYDDQRLPERVHQKQKGGLSHGKQDTLSQPPPL